MPFNGSKLMKTLISNIKFSIRAKLLAKLFSNASGNCYYCFFSFCQHFSSNNTVFLVSRVSFYGRRFVESFVLGSCPFPISLKFFQSTVEHYRSPMLPVNRFAQLHLTCCPSHFVIQRCRYLPLNTCTKSLQNLQNIFLFVSQDIQRTSSVYCLFYTVQKIMIFSFLRFSFSDHYEASVIGALIPKFFTAVFKKLPWDLKTTPRLFCSIFMKFCYCTNVSLHPTSPTFT